MKVSEILNTKAAAYVGAGLVAVVAIWWISRKAAAAAGVVVDAVNPASENNLANRAVTAAGQAVTGNENWTLGGAIFELLNPEWAAYDPNKPTPTKAPDSVPLSWWDLVLKIG